MLWLFWSCIDVGVLFSFYAEKYFYEEEMIPVAYKKNNRSSLLPEKLYPASA